MKRVIFTEILCFILMEFGMISGTDKCESKVEIRAVLIPCPPKDTGCEDDDPLSATLADEGALFFKNKNNFKNGQYKDYPSAVTECKRKMVITMKIKNKGKIPCDDEFIVIDHVYDPLTHEKARLLSPVIIKLRQEQMVQLYGLQFQRIVNSNPREDVFTKDLDENYRGCSANSEHPTCGITTYDGKPIKYSEGFCCSCDPSVNAKRELSPSSYGEIPESKDSGSGWNYLRGKQQSSLVIRNPKLLRLETIDGESEKAKEVLTSFGSEPEEDETEIQHFWQEQQSPPIYFFEQDRRTICSLEHILSDLCSINMAAKKGSGEKLSAAQKIKERNYLMEGDRLESLGRSEKKINFQVFTSNKRKKRLSASDQEEPEFPSPYDKQWANLKDPTNNNKRCPPACPKPPVFFFCHDKKLVENLQGKNETCTASECEVVSGEQVLDEALKNIQLKARKMGKITNEDPSDILKRIIGSSSQNLRFEIRNKKNVGKPEKEDEKRIVKKKSENEKNVLKKSKNSKKQEILEKKVGNVRGSELDGGKKSEKLPRERNEDLILLETVPKTKFGKVMKDSPPNVVFMERVLKPKEKYDGSLRESKNLRRGSQEKGEKAGERGENHESEKKIKGRKSSVGATLKIERNKKDPKSYSDREETRTSERKKRNESSHENTRKSSIRPENGKTKPEFTDVEAQISAAFRQAPNVEYIAKGENVHSESELKKIKRDAQENYELAKGFFASEIGFQNPDEPDKMDLKNLEYCPSTRKCRSVTVENERGKPKDESDYKAYGLDAEAIKNFPELKEELIFPPLSSKKRNANAGENLEEQMGAAKLWADDKDRLRQSYGENHMEKSSEKKKRDADSRNVTRQKRGGQNCDDRSSPANVADSAYHESAHCLRFSDLWYSVYAIKKPLLAQIVGIQLYDKHALCDGSTKWRDLTKGNMIRTGTFLSKAYDEVPTISVTFTAQNCESSFSQNIDSIDPDNYRLLIPSHLTDPNKLKKYPQFQGGPAEYLLVDKNDISLSGSECNRIGTSFEAFVRQPDRCSKSKGSCLERQPLDLWREDLESKIRGKRGKYFLENFGTVPNSPIKTYTNLSGDYLALEYYGEYSSILEIEVKADYNAVVRKGISAQIPFVYIDGSHPKKTRIVLAVLNMGLTSAMFRPRLGDCPANLDPSWCPLEGPLVTIAPMQRHDFKLDLSGSLPAKRLKFTVEVLNQGNKKVAQRKIEIRKSDRCFCAFHCRCNCVASTKNYKCVKLTKEEYKDAGYSGQFPVRSYFQPSPAEMILQDLYLIFLTALGVLIFLGFLKGLFGTSCRNVGKYGMEVVVGPARLCRYYECELRCEEVVYDECGFPINPYTCKTAQLVPLWAEVLLNIFFFILYPLRGLWLLMLSIPCCKAMCAECASICRQDDECENDNARMPLMSGYTSGCFNYNVQTSLSTKKSSKKMDKDLLYQPYKGDDDPLEEDDTEFVLEEMKRYQDKSA